LASAAGRQLHYTQVAVRDKLIPVSCKRLFGVTPPLKPTFGTHYRIVLLSAAYLIAR
jgi:hypothetical protein